MTTKKAVPQAVREYLSRIGKEGGAALTGEAKANAGRIGGLKSGQARRKAKLNQTNGQH